MAVGDFNRDGSPDLVTANHSSNNVSVLLGNGSGGFGAADQLPAGPTRTRLAVGDFNRDGIPDLAAANSGSNIVSVLLGNGSGGFARRATSRPGARTVLGGGGRLQPRRQTRPGHGELLL